MKTFKLLILFSALLLYTPLSANEEIGYDEIISELSRSRSSTAYDTDSLSEIKFHVGAGISNAVFSVNHPNGKTTFVSQRGAVANLGIDLFSKHWLAEGTFAGYGEKEYDDSKISLNEFALKLVYNDRIEDTLYYRVGLGLTARYLDAKHTTNVRQVTEENGVEKVETVKLSSENRYSTPASLLTLGLNTYLAKSLSLGVELIGRNSLTNETPDQNSLDIAVRVDGHF